MGGCGRGSADKTYKPLNQSEIPELISADLLENSGLRIGWQSKMFVNPGEKIQQMFIHDNCLFIQTDRNFLYCLDRDSGEFKYGLELAVAGLPVIGPSYYKNDMLFMVGSGLVTVDMEVGRISRKQNYHFIGNGAVFLPVRNDEFVYVTGTNKRLHAVDPETAFLGFAISSDDDAIVNSVVADNEYLVFSTVSGDVISIENDKPKKIWQFQVGGISAPLVRDGQWIYVSSLDRKLYKLSIEDGSSSGWVSNFIAGESLKVSARIGEDVIYQNAGVKGLYAIDKDSGKELWQLRDGFDLLSENGSKTYVIAKPSKLVAMNNAKGEKLFTINFSDVSAHAVNTEDASIYVASDDGRVVSIVLDEF